MTASPTILTDSNPRSRSGAMRWLRHGSLGVACLVLAAGLSAHVAMAQDTPGPSPNNELILAGSLVIPMDNAHQALTAPFNTQAYGLVNALLQKKVAVKWAIKAGKAKDGIDFTANALRLQPSVLASASNDFRAGPFIIPKAYAAIALPVINAYGQNVAVYQLTQDVTVDIRYTLLFKPRIAVNATNSAIHTDILTRAGITQYDVISDFSLLSAACYTLACEPHNGSPAGVAAINSFVLSGGNFIGQCASVLTYENNTPGGYISTGGIVSSNRNTVIAYPNPDLAFSQYEGALTPSPGGSVEDFSLGGSSSLQASAQVHADDAGVSPATWQATAKKTVAGRGGMVFYLGGHEYLNSDLAHTNGERMFLNAAFVPPTRPASCGLDFGVPDAAITLSHSGPFYAGGTGVYTIGISNAGSDSTLNAITVTDTLPAGITYVSSVGTGWSFSVSGQIVIATYAGALPAGAAAPFTITVTPSAAAAPGVTNRAYVSTGGDSNAANDSASDPTTVSVLALVKRAFRVDGTPIPNAAVLAKGTLFRFLIYVNNPGSALTDVSLVDVLAPAFQYLGGTLRLTNAPSACAAAMCTGVEESALFTAANAGTAATDAIDGDVVSVVSSRIDLGNQVKANAQLNLAAGKVFAVIFSVRLN